MMQAIQDCPLCVLPTRAWLIEAKDEKTFVFCATCGLRGPVSLSDELAIKDWNCIPRRPGPQTASVLAELVELLTDPKHGPQTPGEHTCIIGVPDREAFLKEQGVQ